MCECVYVCVSECVCERERESDGRCVYVCERVYGFHTFKETFFTKDHISLATLRIIPTDGRPLYTIFS